MNNKLPLRYPGGKTRACKKLDSILKFFNIFFVPILLVIISLFIGFIQRKKRHQKHIIRETD